MLDLYHAEPTGASARVLIVLEEKALAFRSHYVDVFALGQYRPPLEELAPGGDIPVLVRGAVASTGASAVCELLEEAYPERPLMPAGARDRWCVRVWQKHVDDILACAVSELAWQAHGERSLPPPARAELERALERSVPYEERPRWHAALAGYGEERLARARARVEEAVVRVEAALADADWLAGPMYSLADVAVFAYFKYLPALPGVLLSESATPRALVWLRAVSERPAVRAALARGRAADPFATATPAPERIRWG
jgi:GSH-dependent disulfide-bond oxidoreductase